jgi:mono/diheme cytochrome c family protein
MPTVPNDPEEKRSYAGTFALCSGALLACAIWALADDLFLRRPWKKYQAELSWREIEAVETAIAEHEATLAADPAYQKTQAELAAAQAQLSTGAAAVRRKELEQALGVASVRAAEADQELRFVKSEIEEARYHYDHALHVGHPTDEAEEHIAELEKHKAEAATAFAEAEAARQRIVEEIASLDADVRRLSDEIARQRTDVAALYTRLDGITGPSLELDLPLLGRVAFRTPPVPSIKQVVIPEYDRSKFDTPLARVDRCESCHAAIAKRGHEDAENPLKTHPNRELLLGKHPPEKFGCTTCHAGQGAAVNSVEMAHGEVMFWEHPLLRGERVEASCLGCHRSVQALSGAATIARGERLFEELGCHGCHLTNGYEGLPKVGPSLRRIGAKLDPQWMVRWVQNPHAIRPRTRMPNFLLSEDEAVAISAYLLRAGREESEAWLAANPAAASYGGDAARGKELADSVGCRACHAFSSDEVAGSLGANKDIAPNLSAIATKVGPRWVYHWVKNPRGYSPVAKMPDLRLTDEEARSVTAYLMTLGRPAQSDAALVRRLEAPGQSEEGERLVRKYGCFGCHDIPGMENESRIGVELSTFGGKVLEELFFGDRTEIPRTWDAWTYHKLKNPRVYATRWIEQLMPNFELADEDIAALKVFLTSRVESKVPPQYRASDDARASAIVAGHRVVARYNCTGCHILEGAGGDIRRLYEGREAFAPPDLHGEGAKVQSPWLFNFLKAPSPIRPWLEVRMPTFGFTDEEAAQLVTYFDALDRVEVPFTYVDARAFSPEYLAAGQVLMSEAYFNCFSCHQQGDRKPEGPPEGWAPDLAMAHERLNPDWLLRWITDPQKEMPGTKMPAFYPDGPPDVLGGSDEEQIRALRDYILTLGS